MGISESHVGADHVSELEAALSGALADTQALDERLDAARKELATHLLRALGALVKPGTVMQKYGRDFGRVSVVHGNARSATAFEVVGAPRIYVLNVPHPSLTQFAVEVYPLNEHGKRMSGRSGNSRFGGGRDTVTLSVYLAEEHGPDDQRSCNDMVMELVRRATAAGAG